MIAWFLGAALAGSDPTEVPLGPLMEQLAPQIEAIAGRTFGDLPDAQWVSRREYRERLLRRDEEPGFVGVRRTLSDDEVDRLWWVLGEYSRDDDTIVLVRDQLRGMQERYRLDGDETASLMRCLIVHEMVHALDARHTPERDLAELSTDRRWGYQLLDEGHASWVENEWCRQHEGPEAAARSDRVTQIVSSVGPYDSSVPYGWGTLIVGALYHEDPERFWALHAAEAPVSFHRVQTALAPVLLAGWTDPRPLIDGLKQLGFAKDWSTTPEALVSYLGALDLDLPGDRSWPTAGWRAIAGFRNYSVRIRTFAFAESKDAEAVIEARAAQIENRTAGFPPIDRPTRLHLLDAKIGRARRLERQGATTRFIKFETSFRPYVELWAVHEGRLVVLTGFGLRKSRLRDVEDVVAELFAQLPTDVAPGNVWTEPLFADLD